MGDLTGIGDARKAALRLAAVYLAAGILCAGAADWPHFRGLDRNGVVPEGSGWTGKPWPPGEAAWTAQVGKGCTAPLVVGETLYVLGWKDRRDHLYALDAATGAERWRQEYACLEYGRYHTGDEGEYGGPSATPEYDPQTGYLYTLSIDGDLRCWDTRQAGRPVWKLNLYDAYRPPQRPFTGQGRRDYGYTTAPLVHDEWVIVEVGAPEGNLIAFDRRNGQRRWCSQNRDPAGHTAGPLPLTVQGVPCVAVLTLHRLLVVRLDAGREGQTVATYDWQTDYANNVAAPAVAGNQIALTSNYNLSKTVLLNVALNGVQVAWTQGGKYTKVCPPLIHQGCLYLATTSLKCLDLATGNLRWQGGRFGDDASVVHTADGHLMVFGHGTLALVDDAQRSPDKYSLLAEKTGILSDRAWPHLVFCQGRCYVKNRFGCLKCFVVRPP